jgi:ribosome-binding factor A
MSNKSSMIGNSRTSDIKRAQKESVLFRLISELFRQAAFENPALANIFVNRVELSPGKSMCTVYLYTAQGKEYFDKILPDLKIYKPSMRKAIADTMQARYTADLVFKFDEQFEKTQRIERLIDTVKTNDME